MSTFYGDWDLETWLSGLGTLNPDSFPPEERLCNICRLPFAPTSPAPLTLNQNGQTEEPTEEHPLQLACGHVFGGSLT